MDICFLHQDGYTIQLLLHLPRVVCVCL